MTTYKRLLMAAVVLTLTAGLALAKDKPTSSTSVTLTAVTTMPDGAQLKPGDYKLTLLNDSSAPQVELYKDGKLVCKCPVKIQNNPTKAAVTRLLFGVTSGGEHILQTIEVRGWTQLLVFSEPKAPGL